MNRASPICGLVNAQPGVRGALRLTMCINSRELKGPVLGITIGRRGPCGICDEGNSFLLVAAPPQDEGVFLLWDLP